MTSSPSVACNSGLISEQNKKPLRGDSGLDHIERLDAERIARGEEFAGRGVDRDEGIHAGEPLDPGRAENPQHIGDDFGVAAAVKRTPRASSSWRNST